MLWCKQFTSKCRWPTLHLQKLIYVYCTFYSSDNSDTTDVHIPDIFANCHAGYHFLDSFLLSVFLVAVQFCSQLKYLTCNIFFVLYVYQLVFSKLIQLVKVLYRQEKYTDETLHDTLVANLSIKAKCQIFSHYIVQIRFGKKQQYTYQSLA